MKGIQVGSRWLVIVLVAVLLWGAGGLLKNRFASGDIYPPYSSLRADPLGLKALYDAFSELPHREVSRFTASHLRFPSGRDRVVVFAGVNPEELDLDAEEFRVLDGYVRQGGRLVMTFRSEAYENRAFTPRGMPAAPTSGRLQKRHLRVEWGCPDKVLPLQWKQGPGADSGVKRPVPALVRRASGLSAEMETRIPAELEWHSAGVFEKLAPDWTPILVREAEHPVMVERSLGLGSIVLATDSYWLSNEAMRRHRELGLVDWAFGGARSVVFDETHLGTVESMGVMTMVREYRLHLFLVVLLILAALTIWRLALSFIPRVDREREGSEDEVVAAMDTGTGLSNLLKRSVPQVQLLSVCLAEWIRSGKGGRSIPPDRLAAAEVVIQRENQTIHSGGPTHPVLVYREITGLLRPHASVQERREINSDKG